MIVKFDHVSYSCDMSKEESVKAGFSGYSKIFEEVKLLNLEIKKEFLKLQAETHNISLLQKEGAYPIEITAYPCCFEGTSKMEVDGEQIVVFTPNKEATAELLRGVGFRGEESLFLIKPMLDAKEVRIKVIEAEADEDWSYLDRQGFGSLAFVTDNASRQKKQLDALGIYTTEVQELTVNNKLLKIFFAKSKAGDLIEFIGMR